MNTLSMTDAELELLLGDLESDRVERKESLAGEAPKKNGDPPLVFDVELNFVGVTLKTRA